MLVQTKLNIKMNEKNKEPKFKCLILDIKSPKNSFNGKILGLELSEWVKFACDGYKVQIVEYDKKTNIIDFAKNYIEKDDDYMLVLLSITPLLQKHTIKDICEYSTFKNINLCKLQCGYVLKNEYILNSDTYNVDSIYTQNIEDFYVVESKAQFNFAYKILQSRINDFHLKNGVDLVSPDMTYIEPFVDIESGVKIFPNNSIKGKSTIKKDVILKENNVIEDSKIGVGSCISASEIQSSVISTNVYIASFCSIKNSLVGSDVTIENGVSINNYNVAQNQKIKANSVLGETNDSNSGIR